MKKKVMLFSDNRLCHQFLENLLFGTEIDIKKYDPNLDYFNQIACEGTNLILLDKTIGVLNGFIFLKDLRENEFFKHIPVIFFTANAESQFKIAAFELGALDCISITDNPTEIVARIKNKLEFMRNDLNVDIVRHVEEPQDKKAVQEVSNDMLLYADLKVDYLTHQVFDLTNGKCECIPLSFLDYKILMFFLKNIEVKVSRNMLIKNVWGENIHISNRTVDVHISGLRKKSPVLERYIKTIYGKGYFFSENDSATEASIESKEFNKTFQNKALNQISSVC